MSPQQATVRRVADEDRPPARAPAPQVAPRRSDRRAAAIAAPVITVYFFILLALAEVATRGTVPVTGRALLSVALACAFGGLLLIVPIAAVLVVALARVERWVRRHDRLVIPAFRGVYLFTYFATTWRGLNSIVFPYLHVPELPNPVYHGGYLLGFAGVAAHVVRRRAEPPRVHPSLHLVFGAVAAYWLHVESSYNSHVPRTYLFHLATGAVAFVLLLGAVIAWLCHGAAPRKTIRTALVGAVVLAAAVLPFRSHWAGSFAARRDIVDGSHVGRYAMRIARPLLDVRGLEVLAARATPATDLGTPPDDGTRARLAAALAARTPRNVLFISVDTLRRDAILAGHPAFARLLREGISFDRTVATVPVTRPSLRAMITGAHPGRPFGATLTEVAKQAGMATYFVATFPNLVRDPVARRGFDRVDDRFLELFNAPRAARPLSDAFLGWLDAGDDRPFFAWIHYLEPHAPYHGDGWGPRARYESEIRALDGELDRLLGELERRGRLDDTMIVLVGDHGEELGEHGGRWHGHTLHEEALRVPFLIRAPGGQIHGAVTAPVSGVDVAATLAAAAGLPAPAGFSPDGENAFVADVERGRWKLILQPKFGAAELYDLVADPGELVNLVDREPAVAAALARDLAAHLAR